jgi:hypothetical protein
MGVTIHILSDRRLPISSSPIAACRYSRAAGSFNLQTRPSKPKNDRWLKRHPNVHFHFTPTRASWLNQVEIWFSILQGKSLHGASFTPVEQLRRHIDAFIDTYNEIAKPFVWTKAKVHQKRLNARFADQ